MKARIVIQNALFTPFGLGKKKLSDLVMPWVTYTSPEIAHVGMYAEGAKEKGIEFNTIKVKFRNGPLVFFNTKTDVVSQIDRLVLVKKEKIGDNFSKTNYIDLRYGSRIFIN
jgi:pyruvate/2-oxoglutarate dehydrogenase complex dihydrolipoamide dehydrogenase (E3) component